MELQNLVKRYGSTCLLFACVISTAVLSGCGTTQLLKLVRKEKHATVENPVTSVLCIWQEGTDNFGGRGFMGRVMFFTAKDKRPVQVDGEVSVFVFDDQGTREEQVRPLHKYEFGEEAWSKLYGVGKLGPSYTVYIPYPRQGLHQARCALRLKLSPREGPVVFSDLSDVVLTGSHSSDTTKTTSGGETEKESEDDQKQLRAIIEQKFDELAHSAKSGQSTDAERRLRVQHLGTRLPGGRIIPARDGMSQTMADEQSSELADEVRRSAAVSRTTPEAVRDDHPLLAEDTLEPTPERDDSPSMEPAQGAVLLTEAIQIETDVETEESPVIHALGTDDTNPKPSLFPDEVGE